MFNQPTKVFLVAIILTLSACFSATPLNSSLGYYGSAPGAQEVKDSYGQSVQTFLVAHDTEDVRQAVIKGAGFIGLRFDNVKDNMLTGTSQWVPPGFTGGCAPNQVYAVYLTEVSARETSVTIVADHVTFCAAGMNSQLLLVQRIVSNMNSVLATYE